MIFKGFFHYKEMTSVYFLGLYSTLPPQAVILSRAIDTSSYSFLTSGTVTEYLNFAARTLAQRTERGKRQTLGLDKYPFAVHCYKRGDGLTAIAITRPDYPTRPIYSVMYKS